MSFRVLYRSNNIHDELVNYISKSISMIENGFKNGDFIQLELHVDPILKKKTVICFPNIKEVLNWKFIVYLRLLKLIYDQLIKNETISKRQLYYSDVNLFKKQATVDECLDKLSICLCVTIETMNVVASQKGLIFADLSINNQKISRKSGSSLIPIINSISSVSDFEITFNGDPCKSPKSIIILEKDAILSGLVIREKSEPIKQFENSILITARGYPDRLTKHFVKILVDRFPDTPIFGYFDSDVYGLLIALEYKVKPVNISIQTPACPCIVIKGASLFSKNVSFSDFIPLTEKDISTSFLLLNRIENFNDDQIQSIDLSIQNLQRTIYFGCKRELKLNDVQP